MEWLNKTRYIFESVRSSCLTSFLCLLGSWVFSAFASAESSDLGASLEEIGYSVTHFSVIDGLPLQHVTALAQTPDGYLWIGSTAGLIRYDGNEFKVFSTKGEIPMLRGFRILNLYCDRRGRLWMGAIGQNRVIVYENDEFRSYGPDEGLPFLREPKFGEASDGSIWVRHDNETCSYILKNDRFERRDYENLKVNELDVFRVGEDEVSWGVRRRMVGDKGANRILYRFSQGRYERYFLKNPAGKEERTLGRLFHLSDGRLAIPSTRAIYELEEGKWKIRHAYSQRIGRTGAGSILDAVEDPSGNYWISIYDKGLHFSSPGGKTEKVVLPHGSVNEYHRALLVDTEGNVWIAGTSGLFRIKRQIFQQVHAARGQKREFDPRAFVEDGDGRLRIAYVSGWAKQKKLGWEFTPHGHRDDVQITSMVKGGDGVIYVGYQTKVIAEYPGFVEKLYPDGRREHVTGIQGEVKVLLEDKEGVLWIGAIGLWRWADGKLEEIKVTPKGAWVSGLIEDSKGRLYASVYGYGILCKESEKWSRIVTPDSPAGAAVRGLQLDPDGETVWTTGDSIFARWKDGEWLTYPPYSESIQFTGIAIDDVGGLWMGSNAGVFRVDRSLLDAWDDDRETKLIYEWFDRSDGLPTDSVAPSWLLQSAIFSASDGKVWIATGQGAVVADPLLWQERKKSLPSPPVYIESIVVDDEVIEQREAALAGNHEGIEISPGRHRMVFHYTAINLTAHKQSRFRYRLLGLKSEWIEAGMSREAVYHDLSPGDYRFEVIAENKNGVWSAAPGAFAFTVQPHWWQRMGVQIAAVILFLLLVYSIYQIQMNSLRRKHVQQIKLSRQLIEAQEVERKRIASELHDNLGQNLLVIKTGLSLEVRKEGVGEENRERIMNYAQVANDCVSEVRQMSQELRPYQVDRLGLNAAIESVAERLDSASEISISYEMDDLKGAISVENQIHILRIVQETLGNAMKHSKASRIELKIRRQGGKLDVSVQDDGCGFNVAEAKKRKRLEGGMGLSSLKERVEILNGTFQIVSEPNKGTLLRFVIPEAG